MCIKAVNRSEFEKSSSKLLFCVMVIVKLMRLIRTAVFLGIAQIL